jgi:hypothetical protein
MTWGAYGAEHPSDNGIRWPNVSEDSNRQIRVPADQDPISAAQEKRPQ